MKVFVSGLLFTMRHASFLENSVRILLICGIFDPIELLRSSVKIAICLGSLCMMPLKFQKPILQHSSSKCLGKVRNVYKYCYSAEFTLSRSNLRDDGIL